MDVFFSQFLSFVDNKTGKHKRSIVGFDKFNNKFSRFRSESFTSRFWHEKSTNDLIDWIECWWSLMLLLMLMKWANEPILLLHEIKMLEQCLKRVQDIVVCDVWESVALVRLLCPSNKPILRCVWSWGTCNTSLLLQMHYKFISRTMP